MNELKVFMVASSGSMVTQMAQGDLPMVGDGMGELLVKTLISVVGGIISTLAYKLIYDKMGDRPLFRRRSSEQNKKMKK